MISIKNNELSVAAQRHLNTSNRLYQGTIQKLASGSRIVQASDDPAGLAISDNLNATIRSLGQAVRNSQDGISLVQVFEGGTNEITNMIIRVRELAMQSASDTIGDQERSMLQAEVDQLKQEIDRVARTTRYAGQDLLNGDDINLEFQVGTNNNPEIDRITFAPGNTNMTPDSLGIGGVDLSEKTGAQESLDLLDQALNQVNDIRARVGATQNRLLTTMTLQNIFTENLTAAMSRIRDADIGHESSELARTSILRQAGVAVLTQANQTPMLALQLLKG